MKKKIATLLLLTSLMASATFAYNHENGVNKKALTIFTERFADAEDVRWTTTDNYLKATFKQNDQFMFAFFSPKGELMGVSRNLMSNQLPINLQTELKKNFPAGWVTELFEYATAEETTFYATIENADMKISLKSTSNNFWIVNKKAKK